MAMTDLEVSNYLANTGVDSTLLATHWASLTGTQQTTVYQFAATTPGGCPRPSANNTYAYGVGSYGQQVGLLFANYLSGAQQAAMIAYGSTVDGALEQMALATTNETYLKSITTHPNASNYAWSGVATQTSSLIPNLQLGNRMSCTGTASTSNHFAIFHSMSADGGTIAAMTDAFSTSSAVWIYKRSPISWTVTNVQSGVAKIDASLLSGKIGNPIFKSIALSGDGNTVVIGDAGDNSNQGTAWVFTFSNGTWTQQAKLATSDSSGTPEKGVSVAISGDGSTIAMGGPGDNSNKGAVWLYTKVGGVWTQQGFKICPDAGGAYRHSENAISLSYSGDVLAIHSMSYTGSGATFIYARNAGSWTMEAGPLSGTSKSGTPQQGWSGAMNAAGTIVTVGGIFDNAGGANTGALWVFEKVAGVWSSNTKLVGTGATSGPLHGRSTAISSDGSLLLSGAAWDASIVGGQPTGAGWIFQRSGAGSWVQQGSKIVATGVNNNNCESFTAASMSSTGNIMSTGAWSDTNKGAMWLFGNTLEYILYKEATPGTLSATTLAALAGNSITTAAELAILAGCTHVTDDVLEIIASHDNATETVYAAVLASSAASNKAWAAVAANTDSLVPAYQLGSTFYGSGYSGAPLQGVSVSCSATGNYMAVGGCDDNGIRGAAWLFKRNPVAWQQLGAKLSGTSVNERLGFSMALSGDVSTMVVGGHTYNGSGAVRVFTNINDVWSQQGAQLIGSTGGSTVDYQGFSVASSRDGNTIAVGGRNTNSAGAVIIYNRSNGVWSQQDYKIVGSGVDDGASGYGAGSGVALSGDGNTLAVGWGGDNSRQGAVWIFTRSGGVWSQQGGKLAGTGYVSSSRQGTAVALSEDGNTLAVGGYGDNSNIGAVWIWTCSDGVWTQQGNKLVVSNSGSGPCYQGSGVALSSNGNTLIVGGGSSSGDYRNAWVFTRSGSTWTQQTSMLGGTSYSGARNEQGYAVSCSADGNVFTIGGYFSSAYVGNFGIFGNTLEYILYKEATPSTLNATTLEALAGNRNATDAELAIIAGCTNANETVYAAVLANTTASNLAWTAVATHTTVVANLVTIAGKGTANLTTVTAVVGNAVVNDAVLATVATAITDSALLTTIAGKAAAHSAALTAVADNSNTVLAGLQAAVANASADDTSLAAAATATDNAALLNTIAGKAAAALPTYTAVVGNTDVDDTALATVANATTNAALLDTIYAKGAAGANTFAELSQNTHISTALSRDLALNTNTSAILSNLLGNSGANLDSETVMNVVANANIVSTANLATAITACVTLTAADLNTIAALAIVASNTVNAGSALAAIAEHASFANLTGPQLVNLKNAVNACTAALNLPHTTLANILTNIPAGIANSSQAADLITAIVEHASFADFTAPELAIFVTAIAAASLSANNLHTISNNATAQSTQTIVEKVIQQVALDDTTVTNLLVAPNTLKDAISSVALAAARLHTISNNATVQSTQTIVEKVIQQVALDDTTVTNLIAAPNTLKDAISSVALAAARLQTISNNATAKTTQSIVEQLIQQSNLDDTTVTNLLVAPNTLTDAISSVALAAARLQTISNNATAKTTQSIVEQLIQQANLDDTTVSNLVAANDATMQNSITNIVGLASLRLQTIAGNAAVRGKQAIINAIVAHPNFDADAATALIAGGVVTALKIRTAIQAAATINSAGLAVLLGVAGVNSDLTTVAAIIQQTSLNDAVLDVLDLTQLVAAITATAGLVAARLHTMVGNATVLASDPVLIAIAAHSNLAQADYETLLNAKYNTATILDALAANTGDGAAAAVAGTNINRAAARLLAANSNITVDLIDALLNNANDFADHPGSPVKNDVIILHNIVANSQHTAATDTAVIGNPNTEAADLVTIANRTLLAADLTAIVAHANHTSATDIEVIANINTLDTDLIVIAARTTSSTDLHNIVAHGNRSAASDSEVIDNENTLAADLATIAERISDTTDLHNIVIHTHHSAASDSKVIANVNTLAADLVTVAARITDTDDLHNIVVHANRSAATDSAVIDNANTLAADLITIAERTTTAADLSDIVNHAKHSAATDTEVIANINTLAADLAIIAPRTISAEDLAAIVAHPNHAADSDTAVVGNSHTAAAELLTIANRTTLAADLTAIVNHSNHSAATDSEVGNNDHTLEAELITIANRTTDPADLTLILNHPNRSAATDQAIAANTHLSSADFATLLNAAYNTPATLHALAANTGAGALAAAGSAALNRDATRAFAADPNITEDILNALVANNNDFADHPGSKVNDDATVLDNIANNPRHSTVTDSALIAEEHTPDDVLVLIARRTNSSTDLSNIVMHPNHTAATDSEVIDNIHTVDTALAIIAERSLATNDLHKIVDHSNHSATSDTAVIANTRTLAADLITIAERTNSSTDLHNIVAHGHHSTASDSAVIDNDKTLAAELITIANRISDTTDLHNIVIHGHQTAATDSAVISNPNTLVADLVTIAGRITDPDDLHDIVMHANKTVASDHAVLTNSNTLAADLIIIAGRNTPTAADLTLIVNHANHSADSDSAAIANDNMLADDLEVIARRTVKATDLTTIVGHANHSAATDTAVIDNSNTLDVDLITIAERTASSVILHNITVHSNHSAASDRAVISKDQTDSADLSRIAARAELANDLHNIVIHEHHAADSDSAVSTNIYTAAEDLAVIAERTSSSVVLNNIVIHRHHNAVTDTAVLNKTQTNAADLLTIAERTLLASDLNLIVAHGHRTAATDTEVLNNTHTAEAELLTITARTLLDTDLHLIVAHGHRTAATDTEVLNNTHTAEPELLTIAARTLLDTDLNLIVAHGHRTAATDTEVLNNTHTAEPELLTITARTLLDTDLHLIVAHDNRTAVTDTAVLNKNQTAAADLLTIAERTLLASDLNLIVAHGNRTAATDTEVLNNTHTAEPELLTITARTLLDTDLHLIVAHGNRTAVTDTAVLNKNQTAAADLLTIAERTLLASDLNLIVAHGHRTAATDTAVLNNSHTVASVASLTAIAARTHLESDLTAIDALNDGAHGFDYSPELQTAIINNSNIGANLGALTELANVTLLATDLDRLAILNDGTHGFVHNAALDTAILSNTNTVASVASLTAIATRTTLHTDLAIITGLNDGTHGFSNDYDLDIALVTKNNLAAADLTTILNRTNDLTLIQNIKSHTNASQTIQYGADIKLSVLNFGGGGGGGGGGGVGGGGGGGDSEPSTTVTTAIQALVAEATAQPEVLTAAMQITDDPRILQDGVQHSNADPQVVLAALARADILTPAIVNAAAASSAAAATPELLISIVQSTQVDPNTLAIAARAAPAALRPRLELEARPTINTPQYQTFLADATRFGIIAAPPEKYLAAAQVAADLTATGDRSIMAATKDSLNRMPQEAQNAFIRRQLHYLYKVS